MVDQRHITSTHFSSSKKALILLSGGLNSGCLLSFLIKSCAEIYAVSFNYGQQNLRELRYAEILAALANVKSHKLIKIDFLKQIFKSHHPGTEEERFHSNMSNAIAYFSIGAAAIMARYLEIRDLFVGSSKCDTPKSFSFGGEPEALAGAARAISASLHYEVNLLAPFIDMNMTDVIRVAIESDGLHWLADTHSCLSKTKYPCGKCGGCLERAEAFRKVGIEDPIRKRILLESLAQHLV